MTMIRDTLLFLNLLLPTTLILTTLSPARNTWTGRVQTLPSTFNAGIGWLVQRVQPTLCSAAEHCGRACTYVCFGGRRITFVALGETIRWENSWSLDQRFLCVLYVCFFHTGHTKLQLLFSWAAQTRVVWSDFFIKDLEQSSCSRVRATFS